ncbi:MAG: type II secretion system protein [Lachnospiraceae bacterium]|nr:type II secretion system protein [Lachnospiraceae bacterium]
MKIFNRFCKKNIGNKGITLVELICTIAILSLIGTVVVGLVLAATRSYQSSVQEIEVQQEAQFAANLIGDLVKDATSVNGDTNKIEIEKGGVLYTITYNGANRKIMIDDGSGAQLLAENVDGLPVVPTVPGSVHEVSMRVSRSDSTGAMNLVNVNNSRNETPGGGVAEGEVYATILSPSEMILEPKMEKEIVYTVTGTPDKRVNWTVSGSTDPNTIVDGNEIKIGSSEIADLIFIDGETVARKRDGVTPAAYATIIVYIRRVTGITLNAQLLSGADSEAGALYRFTANVSGVNLERKPTMETDYITPYAIDWSYDYRINGTPIGNPYEYFSVTNKSSGDGENENYVDIRLNRKVDASAKFTLYATAAHPKGRRDGGAKANKSGIQYCPQVYASYLIEGHLYTLYPGNFYRGSDQRQGELDEWTVISLISSQYGIQTYGLSIFKEVRYRVTGTNNWTPWIELSEGGSAIRIHEDCWMFAGDKDYDIEIRFGCKNLWGQKFYPTVLGENAYTIRTSLEHARIRFDVASDRFSQNDIYGVGPLSNPIRMSVGTNLKFIVNQNEADRQGETGLRWDRFNQSLIIKIQRLDGNTWNDVGVAYRQGNRNAEVWVNVDSGAHFSMMTDTNRQIRFNRRGTYRILIGIGKESGGKDVYIRNYVSNGWYSYYTTVWNQNYHLWNETTGEGIFYISVE